MSSIPKGRATCSFRMTKWFLKRPWSKTVQGVWPWQKMKYSFSMHDFVMKKKKDVPEYSLSITPDKEFRIKRTLGRKWGLPAPVKELRISGPGQGILSEHRFSVGFSVGV